MSDPRERSQSQLPHPDEISSIYDEVLTHNREHTGVGAIFSGLVAVVAEAEPIDLSATQPPSGEETEPIALVKGAARYTDQATQEGELAGDIVVWSSDEPMQKIGIRIDATGAYISQGSTDKKASAQALVPHLDSPSRFGSFLTTVEKEDLTANTSLRQLTTDVVDTLSQKVKTMFARSPERLLDMSDEEVEALGISQLQDFASIADEYERLGIDDVDSFKQMREYVRRWGEGALPDYLIAEQKAYFEPDVQGFGPARWQTDMVPGKFAERWDEAIAFVQYLQGDSSKQKFGNELKERLAAALDEAQEWMTNPPAHYPQEYLNRIRPAFDTIVERFSQL